jgi:hypothetical protein
LKIVFGRNPLKLTALAEHITVSVLLNTIAMTRSVKKAPKNIKINEAGEKALAAKII